jgi:Histidine kinase-, DNA gyrase B-, and HSP90-like ATPase
LNSNSLDWARRVEAPKIQIVVSADGDNCEIVVSDNGPGIPADVAGRVFDPLFARKEGGRGTGLAAPRRNAAHQSPSTPRSHPNPASTPEPRPPCSAYSCSRSNILLDFGDRCRQ